MNNEAQFETELIQYLTDGRISKPEHLNGIGNLDEVEDSVAGYPLK
jgi:type I restriction enzyme R subunit